MESANKLMTEGNNFLKCGDYKKAAESFRLAFSAINDSPRISSEVRKTYFTGWEGCWLLLHGITALVRLKDYEEAFNLLGFTYQGYGKKPGFLIGNPWFHMLSGQIKYELCSGNPEQQKQSGQGSPTDEFSRALIGGGIDIFINEKPEYLELATNALRPPAGVASWEEERGRRTGSNLDSLATANGFLREVFLSRGLLENTDPSGTPSDFPASNK